MQRLMGVGNLMKQGLYFDSDLMSSSAVRPLKVFTFSLTNFGFPPPPKKNLFWLVTVTWPSECRGTHPFILISCLFPHQPLSTDPFLSAWLLMFSIHSFSINEKTTNNKLNVFKIKIIILFKKINGKHVTCRNFVEIYHPP